MNKAEMILFLAVIQKRRDYWWNREIHAAWNDDGNGGHINAMGMVRKYDGQIELMKELISKAKF